MLRRRRAHRNIYISVHVFYSNSTFSTPRSAARAKACGASDRGKRAAISSSTRTIGWPSRGSAASMRPQREPTRVSSLTMMGAVSTATAPCTVDFRMTVPRGTRSRPGSIQNFLDIPHSVQHAHDLNRLGDGIVDDQIGVDGPEFQGTASEILANMSRAWFVTEKLQGTADILQNPARDHRASLLHQEDLYLV